MHHRSVKDLLGALSPVLVGAFLVAGCGDTTPRRVAPIAEFGEDELDQQGMGGLGGTGGTGLDLCANVACESGFACDVVGESAACVCASDDCEALRCEEGSCDPDATCEAIEAGILCTCREGFSGSGFHCSAGDPCEGVTCPGERTECRTDGVTFVCACEEGFEPGQDGSCRDVDECAAAQTCGVGAACLNLPGGYTCDCQEGYRLSEDGLCVDIDECSEGIDSCDELASCQNTTGGHICSCDPPAQGDGAFCNAVSQCDSLTCENGGYCLETPGAARCSCPLGTTGPTCADKTTCDLAVKLNNGGLITDPVLENAVEASVGVFNGDDITVADLSGVFDLELPTALDSASQVKSLEGLECWTHLKTFSASGHAVDDLSPLGHLESLSDVDLSCNPIESISPLVGHLYLSRLNLNQSGFCALTETLPNLASIGQLHGLEELDLSGQGVTDLTALSGLSLLERLVLSDNPLVSGRPLDGLGALVELDLSATGLNALPDLSSLSSLRVLSVSNTALSSLDGVEAATELRRLVANDLGLSSLDPLSGLASLRQLVARNNAFSDIATLGTLPALELAVLQGNEVSGLTALVTQSDYGWFGVLNLRDNELFCDDEQGNMDELTGRGLTLLTDCE